MRKFVGNHDSVDGVVNKTAREFKRYVPSWTASHISLRKSSKRTSNHRVTCASSQEAACRADIVLYSASSLGRF